MRYRFKRFSIVWLICVIAILFSVITAENSAAIELSDLASEFGRIDCTSPPPCLGDLDTDEDVDGSDVALAALASLPEISFVSTSTSANEGETALLELSEAFSGPITVEISGPAFEGNDHGLSCSGQECTATVDSEGMFEVPIIDDDVIEEVEWLRIRIIHVPGYQVGALSEHVITIQDNDAVWEGIFTTKGEELGFSIKILRSGETITASLLAEGSGVIPAGAGALEEPEFPLTFDLGSNTFSATLPDIPLPKEDTLVGTDATMTLELDASESTGSVGPDRVQRISEEGSTTRMRIQFIGQPHLNSNMPGSFVLQRRPTEPSTREVTLEDIN